MAAIRSANTRPELYVRRAIHAAGFRYRVHVKSLPGRPDLVLARHRLVVFVNGCFWHSHDCARGHKTRANADYWKEKLARNVERDRLSIARLRIDGWRVETVWECDLRHGVQRILRQLRRRRG